MLLALLGSANLTPDDLTITLYPDYGQAVGLAQDQVDAATGFVNNEPVQLQLQGIPVNVLTVDDIVPLPGPGLVVGEATLAAKHEALASFVAVTLGAMEQIRADPQKGLDATFAVVPDLATAPDTAAGHPGRDHRRVVQRVHRRPRPGRHRPRRVGQVGRLHDRHARQPGCRSRGARGRLHDRAAAGPLSSRPGAPSAAFWYPQPMVAGWLRAAS